MAELGRARPVVVAAIATILTANIGILSTERARVVGAELSATIPAPIPPHAFVVFGKTDTPFAKPTLFGARVDGSGLVPWSQPPTSTDAAARSHDGTRAAVVNDGNVWLLEADTPPRQLTEFANASGSFCGESATVAPVAKNPMWSHDDRYIAFLSNAHHLKTLGTTFDVLVVNVASGRVHTAYRAADDVCEGGDHHGVDFISLVGWAKSANMAA